MSNNQILKVVIAAQILLLILILVGVTDAYNFLRFGVAIVSIALVVLSTRSKRYYWAALFAFVAVLFNPVIVFSLTKTQWIVADFVLILILLVWAWDYFHSYHKGYLFERYIEQKFPKTEWAVVTYTRDSHKRLQRFVESDGNPDFVFRKISSNYVIAVECKYRSKYWDNTKLGKGIGWETRLSERYGEYSRRQNVPVYLAIGIGGNPKSPAVVSFIPLEIVQNKYPTFIPKEIIEKYKNLPPV